MGVIFISHSSRDNDAAIRIRDWLRVHGWGETFLDLDPAHGLAPGQRWQEELKKAGERCSAVVVLISPNWLASRWCQVEFLLASQLGKLIFGIVIVPTPLADLPVELTAHYQIVDISSSSSESDGLERLRFGLKRAGLDPKDFPWPPKDEPHRPPYRGLRTFEEKDAGIFFGRDAPITRGLDTLRRMRDGTPERMLVILGASGAGKSSFLKAGLLARLLRDEEHFLVLPTVRPERAALTGPQGFLHACGLSAVPMPEVLQSRFAALRQPVMNRLERHAQAARESHRTKPPTLVLPIDQAEELFSGDETESSATLDLLSAAFGVDDNFLVIITIRSDSYASLQGEGRLGDVLRLPFDLPRVSPGAFKEVIEGPGRLAKPEVVFEPSLTDRLAADLDTPDALPLLAFTLERLVADYGQDGKLLLEEYERGLGGHHGAIAKAVDAAFAAALADTSLPSERAEIEALARRALVPWLVRVDEAEGAPKRRVAALSELPLEARRLVRHLIDQRLLVSDLRAGEPTVEVSHEAVLRHWKSLSAWIDEDRANLRALEVVRTAASEWRHRTSADDAPPESWLVHRGERLVDAEALLGRPDYAQILGEEARAYLAACRARQNVERIEESRRRRRTQLGVAAMVLLLLAGAGLVARQRIADAENARTRSVARSRELALQAREQTDRRLHHALLLGVAGTQVSDTVEARGALQAALASRAGIKRLFHSRMTSPIRTAAISRDGRLVAASGCATVAENDVDCTKGQVQIWNVESGMEVGRPLLGHGNIVDAITFNADGSRLYSASSYDGTLIEWDVASGRSSELKLETDESLEPGYVAFNAQFSSSGDTLAVGTFDGRIGIWNIAARRRRGPMLTVFTGEENSVASLAFSPDGNTLIAGSTGGELSVVTVGDSLALRRRLQAHEAWVEAVAVSSGGELAASAGRNGNMTILRGGKTAIYSWGAVYPYAIFLSPDGQKALIGAAGAEVQIWSTQASRSPETSLPDAGIPLAFEWSSRTLVSMVDDRVLAVSQPFFAVPVADAEASVGAIAIDPRGEVLAIGGCAEVADPCEGGAVGLMDLRSGKLLWERPAHDYRPDWIRFSPDGERLMSANQIYSPTIVVWNAKSGMVERELQVDQPSHRGLTSIDFSLDGKWAAVADCAVPKDETYCKEGYVRLWDLESGQAASSTFSGLVDGAQSVAFSPDGRWIAAGADDGKILIWDIDSRREVLSLPAVFESDRGVSEGAERLAFAAGREALVAASSSGSVAVWDLRERRLLVPPISGMAGGGALAVHPAKRQVAMVNDSRQVLLWDFETRELLMSPLFGHDVRKGVNSFVGALAFSPDGQMLLAGGDENGVLGWRLPEESLQLRACKIINRDFTDDEWLQFMGAEPRRTVCPPETLQAP